MLHITYHNDDVYTYKVDLFQNKFVVWYEDDVIHKSNLNNISNSKLKSCDVK